MSDPTEPGMGESSALEPEPKPKPAPPIPQEPPGAQDTAAPGAAVSGGMGSEPPSPGPRADEWASRGRDDRADHGHGGSIFFGVLLVVIGAVFLVGQFAPGLDVQWWAMWPLIIVIGGIVQLFTPGEKGWGIERVFDGLGTILFGIVLLGCTTGYISWSVWWTVITLWPLLVIAAGLAILGTGLGQTWLRLAATLVIWATLLYAVSIAWTGGTGVIVPGAWMRTGGQAFSYSEQGKGVTKAALVYRGGAGEIGFDSGTDLVAVDGVSPYGKPSFSVNRSGSSAKVEVGVGDSSTGPAVFPGSVAARTDVRLSDTAVWDADLQTGASSLDADFSDVKVRDLTLSTGVSSVVVKLGDVPSGVDESSLLVKAGISSVRILVPKDADARIETSNGLVGTSVGGDFVRVDGGWETDGVDSAKQVWRIKTQAGIGSVSIDTY